MTRDFRSLPDPSPEVTPSSILVRLVDALGFRLHWATEGLRPEDVSFAPPGGGMGIRAQMEHLHGVMGFTAASLGAGDPGDPPEDFEALRARVFALLGEIRARLEGMNNDDVACIQIKRRGNDLPVWNMIHGPLADALTHVGQINALRRISGNPARKVNYLVGEIVRS